MNSIRRRRRKLVVAKGSLEPLFANRAPIEASTPPQLRAQRGRNAIAIGAAIAVHGAIALAAVLQILRPLPPPPAPIRREITASIERAKPPPPPPAPPLPKPAPHPEARAPRPSEHTAPPPPAQAGRAIAVEGPADLTSFDLVVGSGTSYAGGKSSASGTNREAVHDDAVGNGPPRSIRAAPDLSRAPSLLDRDWGCDWPAEAQDTDLRDARVTLRVSVDASGAAESVEVIAAPSGGFAEAAKSCAERARYRVALDRAGAPIAAQTALFNVHFLR